MTVTVRKLTDVTLMQEACTFTSGKPSNISLDKMYDCEHSPMRTQLFWVEMLDIPTFVSVHFVRHKVGVEHFAKTNREDRGGDTEADRLTPINHAMLINAQGLVNMARKRLCNKASVETRQAMQAIVLGVAEVDKDLIKYLVPECVYRGRCHELRSCGGWVNEI